MNKPSLEATLNPFASDTPPAEELTPEAALATAAGREYEPETPAETPETTETTPETPAETPDPAETTPETTEKPRQPSRKDLATQLETANAELARLKSESGVTTQKYKDAEAVRAELQTKLEERDKDFVKARTPVYNWKDDPEVAKPREEIVEMLNDVAAEVTPETAKIINADLIPILNAYGKARGDGAEALRGFRGLLIEKFGEDGERVWEATKAMFPKHNAAILAERKNSEGYFARTLTEHATRSRQFREEFSQIGRMTPEQIAQAPDSTNALISAAIGGDEALLKEVERMAMQAAQATAGLPPLPATATPEEVEAYRASERSLQQFKDTKAFRRDVEARVLEAIVKKLSNENATLRKRVGAAAEGNRPESTSSTPTAPKAGGTKTLGPYEDIPNPYTQGR